MSSIAQRTASGEQQTAFRRPPLKARRALTHALRFGGFACYAMTIALQQVCANGLARAACPARETMVDEIMCVWNLQLLRSSYYGCTP